LLNQRAVTEPRFDGGDAATRVACVRRKVAAGCLPSTPCTTLWGRPGHSAICEACGTMAPPTMALQCRDRNNHVFTLCHACFGAWVSVVHTPEAA